MSNRMYDAGVEMLEREAAKYVLPYTFTRDLIEEILRHPERREWSLQGFGMLRTYIGDDKEVRLHVWDDRFANLDVSQMHTHPWNFHSLIVAGEVYNTRYAAGLQETGNFMQQKILCGEGGHEVGEPKTVSLRQLPVEFYQAGDTYTQHAHEIHISEPVRGSVTLIRREFLDDTEHAYVFWPIGKEWVTAEPRKATDDEVAAICGSALERWF